MPRSGMSKKSSQVTDGPVGLGTAFVDQGTLGTFRGGVVAFHKPSRVVINEGLRWFVAPVVEARLHHEFRAVPRGTAVHHIANRDCTGSSD